MPILANDGEFEEASGRDSEEDLDEERLVAGDRVRCRRGGRWHWRWRW